MLGFVLRRLASAIPTIFIVVTISFFLMRFAPGGPFNLERALPPQIMANMLKAYQLDQPLYMQYLALSVERACTAISARATSIAISPSPS